MEETINLRVAPQIAKLELWLRLRLQIMELVLSSADEAYVIFQQAANAQLSTDVERIAFGAWASTG